MHGKKENNLIVIENGTLVTYVLDDKLIWEVGRRSYDTVPDICLHTATVSRKHGRFENIDGVWFYLDNNGKNGTVYNGQHITPGIRGRIKPITLNDKDIFIFGGGEEPVINSKTVWAMFSEHGFDERWRVEDTKGLEMLSFTDGIDKTELHRPQKGTVIDKEYGLAVYMGNITYLVGKMAVSGI